MFGLSMRTIDSMVKKYLGPTPTFFVLIQYRSVTDGQTDRQTDGHIFSGYTSACIACYANALIKTVISETLNRNQISVKIFSL